VATDTLMIDRAAREALRAKVVKPDLLKEGFPFNPGLWNIVVEPIESKEETEGGIVLAAISQEADAFQVTCGRVLKVGPACMEGRTTSGIELCNFLPSVQTPQQLIGLHVLYQLHTGMSLYLRKTNQRIIVMKVTDLLGETSDPNAWKFYV
jgi:co-chaperonin GroES (HSP10)